MQSLRRIEINCLEVIEIFISKKHSLATKFKVILKVYS